MCSGHRRGHILGTVVFLCLLDDHAARVPLTPSKRCLCSTHADSAWRPAPLTRHCCQLISFPYLLDTWHIAVVPRWRCGAACGPPGHPPWEPIRLTQEALDCCSLGCRTCPGRGDMGWLGRSLCGDSHVGWRGVREGLVASLTLLVGAWDKKGFQLRDPPSLLH